MVNKTEQLFMILSMIKDDINRTITINLNPNYYTKHPNIMIDYSTLDDYLLSEGLYFHYKEVSCDIDNENIDEYISKVSDDKIMEDIYAYLLHHYVDWTRAVKVITQMSQYYLSQNILS